MQLAKMKKGMQREVLVVSVETRGYTRGWRMHLSCRTCTESMGAPYRVDTRAHRSRNTCCLLEYSRSCADNTDADTMLMYARMTMIDADHDVELRT